MSHLNEIIQAALPLAGQTRQFSPQLAVYSTISTSSVANLIYEPLICLVLQGQKRTRIGDRTYEYGAGDCLVITAELTAQAQITRASPAQPFISITLALDQNAISSILFDLTVDSVAIETEAAHLSVADSDLMEAWLHFVRLIADPFVTSAGIKRGERELLTQVLASSQGTVLRHIALPNSRLSQVRRAMAWIRDNYGESLKVAEMAKVAGMSGSAFHRHFKAVTGVSPLEYQKHIRLHEARRRLVTEKAEAAMIAYEVGYESPNQFSREYKRLFGLPPKKDAAALNAVVYPVDP